MIKIYSEYEPAILLHIILQPHDIYNRQEERFDVISEKNFIQCAVLNMDKKKFKPHIHIIHECKNEKIAQESWVILKGSVKFFCYDIVSNKPLSEHILTQGCVTFTLAGGHTYEILEQGTVVLEYKTGPYFGQEKDKRFI